MLLLLLVKEICIAIGVLGMPKNIVCKDSAMMMMMIHQKHTWSALMHACCKGHEKIVQLLLHAGAMANAAGYQYTPLMLAAANGHLAIVKILLHANALPNQPSLHGYDHQVPLNEAVKAGHLADIVRTWCRPQQVPIDVFYTKYGVGGSVIQGTPLEWARQWKKDNVAMVSLLEEHYQKVVKWPPSWF